MSESTSKGSSLVYSEEDSNSENSDDNKDDVNSDSDSDQNDCSMDIPKDSKDDSESDVIDSSFSNSKSKTEKNWEEPYLDAVELESLAFSLRRHTAREKLLKFTHHLKYFSRKLKQICDRDTNGFANGSIKRNVEEQDDVISDSDRPSGKRHRATPLEPKTSTEENGTQMEAHSHERQAQLYQPPILKTKDKWVQNNMNTNPRICKSFEISNSCPLQSKCTYVHIYKSNFMAESNQNHRYYTKEDLFRAYERYQNIVLSKTDIQEKAKNDELNIPRFSSSFICPISKTIYYAQPCFIEDTNKCVKSSQGIWWFDSMKASKDMLSTIVIRDLISKGILPNEYLSISDSEGICTVSKEKMIEQANIMAQQALTLDNSYSQTPNTLVTPASLPLITVPNFAETDFEFRCSSFNSFSGCPNGILCPYAHIYFPKTVNKLSVPDKRSLSIAYKMNFQISIDDTIWDTNYHNATPFRIASTVDDHNNSWYTAAFHCPKEKIIYYACGGPSGHLNSQNIFLYPSVEDAKLAVVGVVLDAFAARGLHGSRSNH
jgi:hypothetical protein